MDITDLFGWFFSFLKSLVYLLNEVLVIDIGGLRISFFSFVLAFFVLHIIISAFIKSGGVKDD